MTCPFIIVYSYSNSTRGKNPLSGYKITKMCLSHNHNVNGTGINLNGCEEVQFLKDILPEELDTIELMALGAHPGMSAMQEILSLHYPIRDFDTQLVWIIINSKRDKVYGKGRHQIGELMRLGRKVNLTGGVWVPQICPETMRLLGCD